MVKIYLSRHGHTAQNEERKKGIHYNHERATSDKSYEQLTPEGIEQAKALGEYLKVALKNPEKALYVSSTKQRTKDTLAHAAAKIGVVLNETNNYVSPAFNEDLSLEEAQKYFAKETNPGLVKWRDSRKPTSELKRKIVDEIHEIARKNPNREIVLVLHDRVNMQYLDAVGAPMPQGGFENCAVYELDFDKGAIKPIEYTPHKKLKKKLEQLIS